MRPADSFRSHVQTGDTTLRNLGLLIASFFLAASSAAGAFAGTIDTATAATAPLGPGVTFTYVGSMGPASTG